MYGMSEQLPRADVRILWKGRVIDIGLTCKCLVCCCPEGQGHKHPLYDQYIEEMERGSIAEPSAEMLAEKGYLEQQADMLRQQARGPGGVG